MFTKDVRDDSGFYEVSARCFASTSHGSECSGQGCNVLFFLTKVKNSPELCRLLGAE